MASNASNPATASRASPPDAPYGAPGYGYGHGHSGSYGGSSRRDSFSSVNSTDSLDSLYELYLNSEPPSLSPAPSPSSPPPPSYSSSTPTPTLAPPAEAAPSRNFRLWSAVRSGLKQGYEWYKSNPSKADGAIKGLIAGVQSVGLLSGNNAVYSAGVGMNALSVAHTLAKVDDRTYKQWAAATVAAAASVAYGTTAGTGPSLARGVSAAAISAGTWALPWLGPDKSKAPLLPVSNASPTPEAQGRGEIPHRPSETRAYPVPHPSHQSPQPYQSRQERPGRTDQPVSVLAGNPIATNANALRHQLPPRNAGQQQGPGQAPGGYSPPPPARLRGTPGHGRGRTRSG